MDDRAEDAFGDLLGVFLQKERKKETQNGSNRLRSKRTGGRRRRMSAIAAKRAAPRTEPRTPGWFVRFMLFFQIAMIYFAPFLAILVPRWSGNDVAIDMIAICLFLPVMLLAQMLIFIVTMMRAISSGVFALGYVVSTFLCSYYLCVFAYALSIHKSQGSEYPHIALALDDHAERLLSRELLYTGITRSKGRLDLYASETALRTAADTPTRRNTGLAWHLEHSAQ